MHDLPTEPEVDASATGENSFSACVKEGVETNKDRLNGCCIFCTILHHTVDGHNPAPVDMVNNIVNYLL